MIGFEEIETIKAILPFGFVLVAICFYNGFRSLADELTESWKQ